MFKAPAAPAPIATDNNDKVALKNLTCSGAINKAYNTSKNHKRHYSWFH